MCFPRDNLGQLVYSCGVIAESCVPLLGAKGKFSGGFDISAFGGLQESKGTSIYFRVEWCLSNVFKLILTLSPTFIQSVQNLDGYRLKSSLIQ